MARIDAPVPSRGLRWAQPLVVVGGLSVFACGPGVSGSGGGEAEAGSGTNGDAGTSAATASSGSSTGAQTSSGSTGGEPFMCERGEELIPGLCFDRYPVELPGPLVGERVTGANLDGLGGDELVVEVLLDGQKRLAMLQFDAEAGTMFDQEAEPTWHPDFDRTFLFTADTGMDGVEEAYRVVTEGLNRCALDDDGTFACEMLPSQVEQLVPALPVDLDREFSQHQMYLISHSPDPLEPGLDVYSLVGGGGLGSFAGAKASPPCEDPMAIGHGDFNGDGFVDIVHHSSTACVAADDPRRDDVNLLLGVYITDFDIGRPGDAEVEPQLLAVVEADDDGLDDVLVHEPARGGEGYRLLRGAETGFGAPESVAGPPGVDRLLTADLDADGVREVLFVGSTTSVGRRPFQSFDSLDASLGRLLAVTDVDGDARDDLVLTTTSEEELLLLVVTD